jgi:hypothetical protein
MLIHINSEHRQENETPENFTLPINVSNKFDGEHYLSIESVQIPLSFYQVRENYNNQFNVQFSNGSTKAIYPFIDNTTGVNIYSGNPTATQICSNIQAQMNINSSGQTFTVTVNPQTAKILFKYVTGANVFTVDFQTYSATNPETSKLLGFVKNSVNTSNASGVVVAPYVINVTPIDSIFIKSNISFKNGGDYESKNKNHSSIIAKIPVTRQDASSFSNLYWNPSYLSPRKVNKLNTTYNFELIYGDSYTPVNLNGLDWSMTLNYINE